MKANVKFNRTVREAEEWWDHERTLKNRPWAVTDNPNIQQLCCYWDDFNTVPNEECPPSRATLECAKQNLKTFTVVGVQEEYGKFLQLLNVRLGITLVNHMNPDFHVCGAPFCPCPGC
jgi:hypothetical protein